MKSTELVCLRRNEVGLYLADADINSIAISMYLKSSGVEVKQYYNNLLISVDDIVEEILSEYMDTVCFIVTKENRNFIYGIGNFFAENEEDTELLFVLTEKDIEEIPFGINISGDNVAQKLSEYLECDQVIDVNELSIESIYRDKIVPVNLSNSIGIILNAKCELFGCTFENSSQAVIEELDYITKFLSFHSQVVLHSDNLQAYGDMVRLTEKMKNANYQQTIQVRDLSVMNAPAFCEKYHAIKNGIRAFYTGLYFDAQEMAYTKHIRCELDEVDQDFLGILSSHNAANSAIYVKGKGIGSKYSEIRDIAVKSGYLLSNIVTYDELDVTDKYDVKINDTDAGVYQIVSYANANEMKDENVFLALDSEESLNAFIADIKDFKETGIVKNDRMWKYDLVDNCRWVNYRSCNLGKLYRMNIKEGQVYPCISSDESIGTTSEMHFALIRNACVQKESTQMERNCADCEMTLYCPKCSMLPGYLTKEHYCEIMCSGLKLEQYFSNMMTIRLFFEYCSVKKLQGVNPQMMEFTTVQHAVTTHQKVCGESRLHEFIMLGKVKEQETYILFNRKNRQALAVNITLHMVAELLYMGCKNNDIYSYMASYFNVTEEEAKNSIDEWLKFLIERGYVKDEY